MIEKSPSRETGAKPALNPDHVLVFISLLFMIVPVICFLWGWTRPYIALIGSVALMYLLRSAYRELKQDGSDFNYLESEVLVDCVCDYQPLVPVVGHRRICVSDHRFYGQKPDVP